MKPIFIFLLFTFAISHLTRAQDTVYLHTLAVELGSSGWKTPQKNTNINGDSLKLAGEVYENGVGVHTYSRIAIDLGRKTHWFLSTIGLDDVMEGTAGYNPIVFKIKLDGEYAYESPVMHPGSTAKKIELETAGKSMLELIVETAGNRTGGTFGNWANARFITQDDFQPLVFKPKGGRHKLAPDEITTASDTARNIISYDIPDIPSINLPAQLGVSAGKEFRIYIPVAGARPMEIACIDLPRNVSFDPSRQILTGILEEGEYTLTIEAGNASGKDQHMAILKVGKDLALTPPMGWNSWNVFGPDITQDKILQIAESMSSSGLINHGWNYVVIDDGWQGNRDTVTRRITGNKHFADIGELSRNVRKLGLKLGIYSTPWVTSYMKLPGGSADTPDGKTFYPRQDFGVYSFHREDAAQFSDWGIDYLKYDWANDHLPYAVAMKKALREQDRDILLSLSGALDIKEAEPVSQVAELWRTNPDVSDKWRSIYERAFFHDRWRPFQQPGHWADMDMLVVGKVGWGKELHSTRLTPWEQVTHVSLWALYSTPLMLGCDLRDLDAFTLALLTNDEVIAVNQDALGKMPQHYPPEELTGVHTFVKEMSDGSMVVGLFNTAGTDLSTQLDFSAYIQSISQIRDLWQRTDRETLPRQSFEVPAHGGILLRIYP